MTGFWQTAARVTAGRVMTGVALALALWACTPKHTVTNPSPFEEDDPAAIGPHTKRQGKTAAENPADEAALPPPQMSGTLARADFDRVLKEGPGRYMTSIAVEAVMNERSGALRGWKIERWPYRWIDLRPGDVVLDVNGTLVVKPDDLVELWKRLADESVLEVRIERGADVATLHFDIEPALFPDRPDAPAPTTAPTEDGSGDENDAATAP